RLTCLEKLRDTRQTVRDVLARHTTGMEGTHRQLGTRLADGLGGDDAHRGADVHRTTGRKVVTVALLADAVSCPARHDRTSLDGLHTRVDQPLQVLVVLDVLTGIYQHLAGLRIH